MHCHFTNNGDFHLQHVITQLVISFQNSLPQDVGPESLTQFKRVGFLEERSISWYLSVADTGAVPQTELSKSPNAGSCSESGKGGGKFQLCPVWSAPHSPHSAVVPQGMGQMDQWSDPVNGISYILIYLRIVSISLNGTQVSPLIHNHQIGNIPSFLSS